MDKKVNETRASMELEVANIEKKAENASKKIMDDARETIKNMESSCKGNS